MIFLQGILVLTKQESWLSKNTIGQTWEKTLRPILEDMTFILLQKPPATSLIETYSSYLYQPIDRKTSW